MNRAERICPHCGAANAPEVFFCGACATALRPITGTAIVRRPAELAPARRSEATKAVAVGLAALAGRAVIALVQNPDLLHNAWRALSRKPEPAPPAAPLAPTSTKRTVIRRRWVVGDVYGGHTWGTEEIEIEQSDTP